METIKPAKSAYYFTSVFSALLCAFGCAAALSFLRSTLIIMWALTALFASLGIFLSLIYFPLRRKHAALNIGNGFAEIVCGAIIVKRTLVPLEKINHLAVIALPLLKIRIVIPALYGTAVLLPPLTEADAITFARASGFNDIRAFSALQYKK